MNPKIAEILNRIAASPHHPVPDKDYARGMLEFASSGDEKLLPGMSIPSRYYDFIEVWRLITTEPEWRIEEKRLVRLAADPVSRHPGVANADASLDRIFSGLRGGPGDLVKEQFLVDVLESGRVEQAVAKSLVENDYEGMRQWGIGSSAGSSGPPEFSSPLDAWIFKATDEVLGTLLWGAARECRFPELLARFRPGAIEAWWATRKQQNWSKDMTRLWPKILSVTKSFDSLVLDFARNEAKARDRFFLLREYQINRGGVEAEATDAAKHPEALVDAEAVAWLLEHAPEQIADCYVDSLNAGCIRPMGRFHYQTQAIRSLYAHAAKRWNGDGRRLFEAIPRQVGNEMESEAFAYLLGNVPPSVDRAIAIVGWLGCRSADDAEGSWDQLAIGLRERGSNDAELAILREGFWDLLGNSSSKLRAQGAKCLAIIPASGLVERAASLLEKGKVDEESGAVAFLQNLGGPDSAAILSAALNGEKNDKVRAAIHGALKAIGGSSGEPIKEATAADLEASFVKGAKKIKAPSCPWLTPETLPLLSYDDGTFLSQAAVAFLISKQAKHKTIDEAPDVMPLLSRIDRDSSAPFAAGLVERFLSSEQAAADRWALTLGGLLGDNRIVALLLPRINDWCENSRHKLAEYSAQAIALLPGNEPLMVLDTLSNRYRSKFKNVGKACAEAFNAAATARGITADELGDMVVPDFGFDAEGIRRFDWNGGGANAELGADFKISWFDPETGKAWKSLPASAPEEIKTEVKTLTKLLREALKGQTARLEMALVRQRRWPVARWRELYENHPVLKWFASGLVWGIHDGSGNLLRTFRRYANGILADAGGAVEELAEEDTVIGIVHPLELASTVLDEWKAHLVRLKVKQPFPQVDRPIELSDPLHGNRREISLTREKKLGAGTFRSRAEKRGWNRGSVIDAGGISSYYKVYPGAGVEVILPTDNFWIGCDPMDVIELRSAYFVKAESVERGSYTYDDPGPDDPRVLRFDQVPVVVWSETVSDLKAIVATKE